MAPLGIITKSFNIECTRNSNIVNCDCKCNGNIIKRNCICINCNGKLHSNEPKPIIKPPPIIHHKSDNFINGIRPPNFIRIHDEFAEFYGDIVADINAQDIDKNDILYIIKTLNLSHFILKSSIIILMV